MSQSERKATHSVSQPRESYSPRGILIGADSVSGDGEFQGYCEFVVTLEPDGDGDAILDVRLDDRKGTIWMLRLSEIDGALKLLRKRAS